MASGNAREAGAEGFFTGAGGAVRTGFVRVFGLALAVFPDGLTRPLAEAARRDFVIRFVARLRPPFLREEDFTVVRFFVLLPDGRELRLRAIEARLFPDLRDPLLGAPDFLRLLVAFFVAIQPSLYLNGQQLVTRCCENEQNPRRHRCFPPIRNQIRMKEIGKKDGQIAEIRGIRHPRQEITDWASDESRKFRRAGF